MGLVLLVFCLLEVEYSSSALTKFALVVISTLGEVWLVKFLQIYEYNVLLIVYHRNHNM